MLLMIVVFTLPAFGAGKASYTVQFWSQGGGSEYSGYRKTVYDGDSITLPQRSDSSAYRFLGWSEKKSSLEPQYTPGSSLTVHKNITLYAVCVKNANVVQLRYNDGKAYKTIVVDGKTDVFPSVAFKNKTLQGWSTKKGRKCNPQYMEGDIIPKRTAVYYMVVATTPSKQKPVSSLNVTDSRKYAYTYFVGDSRMAHYKIKAGKTLKNTKIIAKSGSGYNWLTGTAYPKLIQKIKKDNKVTKKRKAVIFCHGINDLTRKDKYTAFYRSKAKELKALGCDLYVMSVNPYCSKQTEYYRRNENYTEKRTYSKLRDFNTALKGLRSYTYIDIYSYLIKTGWPTASLGHPDRPDGLHYTLETTERIISRANKLMDAHY